MLTVMRQ